MSAKYPFLLLLLLTVALPVRGQYKLGVKVVPGVSFNRLQTADSAATAWTTNGGAAGVVVGPVVDIAFAPNYYFSTGLWYATKRLVAQPEGMQAPDRRNAQYLQLPLSVRLYTDEIRLDTRLYVQMGVLAEVKVNEQDRATADYLPPANLFDGSLVAGTGVEYRWGFNTRVFAGLTYQRGLFNLISANSSAATPFQIRNDLLGLEIGVMF